MRVPKMRFWCDKGLLGISEKYGWSANMFELWWANRMSELGALGLFGCAKNGGFACKMVVMPC